MLAEAFRRSSTAAGRSILVFRLIGGVAIIFPPPALRPASPYGGLDKSSAPSSKLQPHHPLPPLLLCHQMQLPQLAAVSLARRTRRSSKQGPMCTARPSRPSLATTSIRTETGRPSMPRGEPRRTALSSITTLSAAGRAASAPGSRSRSTRPRSSGRLPPSGWSAATATLPPWRRPSMRPPPRPNRASREPHDGIPAGGLIRRSARLLSARPAVLSKHWFSPTAARGCHHGVSQNAGQP